MLYVVSNTFLSVTLKTVFRELVGSEITQSRKSERDISITEESLPASKLVKKELVYKPSDGSIEPLDVPRQKVKGPDEESEQ